MIETIALALFAGAILHTFSAKYFEHLAHTSTHHRGFWHLLGEVEVVFGLWAMALFAAMMALQGSQAAVDYIDSRNYTEPLFVFAIMTVAATRPILESANRLVLASGLALPLAGGTGCYLVALAVIPLIGSFITEPAAMTLAALILRQHFLAKDVPERFKYATLGVLFVNVSIGGTLTHFAAPPVLMVAATWGWDTAFMLSTFGWKAALAVLVNSLGVTLLFRTTLATIQITPSAKPESRQPPIPWTMTLLHLLMLTGIVVFAHHPPVFLGIFLLFMGVAHAYPRYQQRLILKEALLVAYFLAGLVVLGGMQQWWLQPVLMRLSPDAAFWGAIGLTAFTDNAALTYLGSLVEGLSEEFKYALVAGAVTGGGLTIIANAPNPAGIAILKPCFHEQSVSALSMCLAALLPTLVAAGFFLL